MNHMKKTAGVLVASTAVALGTILAAPAAVATPVGKPGAVMTSAEMSAFNCTKGGHGESVGWANCEGTDRFKVRVWCTWAGDGLSDDWRSTYNWAQCSSGVVHSEDNGIEIIWS